MTMQFDEFHNALRILLNIDYREMEQAGVEFGDSRTDVLGGWSPPGVSERRAKGWEKFRDNPHRWFIQASDEDAARVWKIIEARQPRKHDWRAPGVDEPQEEGGVCSKCGAFATSEQYQPCVPLPILGRLNVDDPSDHKLEGMRVMKPGSRYTTGEQPCQNLLRGDADIMALGEGNRRNVHQCPVCEGNRTWCENCHADHHDGGWETCKPGAYAEPEEREDDDTQATPRLLADGFVCDLCNDSGTVAKSVRMSGGYRGPGPVPEHAKGVYEAFCDCEFGQQLAREEVQHYRQQAAQIAAHNREAKETAGRKRVADMIEGEGHDL